jgi:hypothetical protein
MSVYANSLLQIYKIIIDTNNPNINNRVFDFINEYNTLSHIRTLNSFISYMNQLKDEYSYSFIFFDFITEIVNTIELTYKNPEDSYEIACIYYFLKRVIIDDRLHDYSHSKINNIEDYNKNIQNLNIVIKKLDIFKFS